MLAHVHPSRIWFTGRDRPIFNGSVYPALSPGPAKARQVPGAPLPEAGVTSFGVTSRVTSEGTTPPSSLLQAHAPDLPAIALAQARRAGQNPPAVFGCP